MTRLTLPQQRARETRRRIIEAGEAVLTRSGYAEPTVEDIAVEAGVSIGAFYHHFRSKSDLLKAILEEHLDGALVEFQEILAASTLREMIGRFADSWLRHVATTPAFNHLIHELSDEHEAWAATAIAGFHRSGAQAISAVLALAQRFGLVRQGLEPSVAATVILTMMEGVESLWSADRELVGSAAFRAACVDAIERYIVADEPGDMEAFQREAARLFPADDHTSELGYG